MDHRRRLGPVALAPRPRERPHAERRAVARPGEHELDAHVARRVAVELGGEGDRDRRAAHRSLAPGPTGPVQRRPRDPALARRTIVGTSWMAPTQPASVPPSRAPASAATAASASAMTAPAPGRCPPVSSCNLPRARRAAGAPGDPGPWGVVGRAITSLTMRWRPEAVAAVGGETRFCVARDGREPAAEMGGTRAVEAPATTSATARSPARRPAARRRRRWPRPRAPRAAPARRRAAGRTHTVSPRPPGRDRRGAPAPATGRRGARRRCPAARREPRSPATMAFGSIGGRGSSRTRSQRRSAWLGSRADGRRRLAFAPSPARPS